VHGLFFLLEWIVPVDCLVSWIRNDNHRGALAFKQMSCL
jgi:hypothetical protein